MNKFKGLKQRESIIDKFRRIRDGKQIISPNQQLFLDDVQKWANKYHATVNSRGEIITNLKKGLSGSTSANAIFEHIENIKAVHRCTIFDVARACHMLGIENPLTKVNTKGGMASVAQEHKNPLEQLNDPISVNDAYSVLRSKGYIAYDMGDMMFGAQIINPQTGEEMVVASGKELVSLAKSLPQLQTKTTEK